MNNRLLQFLKAENISQAQFADTIGVARASVSHILSGRNRPGFDFIEGMARNYPALNIDWLITGRGKMYNVGVSQASEPTAETPDSGLFSADTPLQFKPAEEPQPSVKLKVNSPRLEAQQSSFARPVRITVFYSDNTFKDLDI